MSCCTTYEFEFDGVSGTSTSVDLNCQTPVALIFPDDWEDGHVAFEASVDGVNYHAVVGVGPGAGFTVSADAGAWVPLLFSGTLEAQEVLSGAEWVSLKGAAFLRLESSPTQSGPRTVTVVAE